MARGSQCHALGGHRRTETLPATTFPFAPSSGAVSCLATVIRDKEVTLMRSHGSFSCTRASICLVALLAFVPAIHATNPIIKDRFTADPAALVSDGRVYLYTGQDDAPVGGTGFVMNNWRVYSSTNMTGWTDHGVK